MLSEEDWEAELGEALGYAVRVRYGRSRTSPIQPRPAPPAELAEAPELRQGWVIRLHRIFATNVVGAFLCAREAVRRLKDV